MDEIDDIQVEWLDHTGDAGLRVTAPTLPRLLTGCAEQMVRLVCPEGPIRPLVSRSVTIEGGDLAELLVNWLAEINGLMAVAGEIYASFSIDALEASAGARCRLAARVHGEVIDPGRHRLEREIKAVTFHETFVRRQGSRWQGQVIFDL
jgi:SHS2 domain-containing protein